MSNFTPKTPLSIEAELNNLEIYKYHPNGILNVSLNRLKDMLDGKVELVDPGNPFLYLLETSSLNTAYAIQEYTMLTRKTFPRLANTEEDLYLHMSDVDYLGRFAEPAYCDVKFNILFSDFKTKAKYDSNQGDYILTLPRHLKVTVDQYTFTLPAAVIIRLTDSGVVDVKYESQDYNNLFPISTNYINFEIYSVNQDEKYITFNLRLPEVDLEVAEIPVEKTKLFKGTINHDPNKSFYYFRAFHLLDGQWVEMLVTHTDQVYDIYTPTCIVKVNQTNSEVNYYIPPVYINTDRLGTKVKFIVYTTNGAIDVNFSDYKVSQFSTSYNPVFPETELNETTQPLQTISKVVYITDSVAGGKDAISLSDLKTAVINNSVGDQRLPVTNKQLDYNFNQSNLKVIRNVDVVTDRIFKLEANIPSSISRYRVSSVNLDILEYITSVKDLTTGKNGIVKINDTTTLITEGTLFNYTRDGLKVLDTEEAIRLKSLSGMSLVNELNNNRYISIFYHYVLDTSNDSVDLRAYDISAPKVDKVNFKEFNSTARVGINSTNSNIVKTPNGFTLDILSNLKKYNEAINETNLTPYIVYKDSSENMFYLEGRLFTTIEESPVYRFELDSIYNINKDNRIVISNFTDSNGAYVELPIPLDAKLELIYVSNVIPSRYTSTFMDNYIYGTYLAIDRVVVTLEGIDITFGYWLEYLYTRAHNSVDTVPYLTYEDDQLLRYDTNVYGPDNTIIHYINEPVLDANGEVIHVHRRGDVVFGEDGEGVLKSSGDLARYLNLTFVDYKFTIPTRSNITEYLSFIRRYLTELVTTEVTLFQEQLLENTVGYMVVPKNLGDFRVRYGGRVSYLKSNQEFRLNVYVNNTIYEDMAARASIEEVITSEIEKYLSENTKLSKTILLNKLYTRLSEFITGISIEKFTDLNEEYIEILEEGAKVSIVKHIVHEPEGYNIREGVSVNYLLV